ncbi:hypothetical protein CBR_g49195 [Chara braunii]|uniref:Mur ligase central domain-containing protein n=1 Tax=Chara braunii TaxID=69332 RepID=A0A388M4H7_CHABU|nr:hypothetical protein CBR_g49195 [Chara braunii]|eukprot:GBG89405.1 hypothetical protein CBR_g49195 [Chara braunii]
MKLKQLQSMLEDVEQFESPNVELEQYPTGAHIAARMMYTVATTFGDIEGKVVVDLGCGCGVLAIAASLLGAAHVIGVDVDTDALDLAKANCENLEVDKVEFVLADVASLGWRDSVIKSVDVVVMNPPFGTRRKGADMQFLRAALSMAGSSVYSLHKSSTRQHVQRVAIAELGAASRRCDLLRPNDSRRDDGADLDQVPSEVEHLGRSREEAESSASSRFPQSCLWRSVRSRNFDELWPRGSPCLGSAFLPQLAPARCLTGVGIQTSTMCAGSQLPRGVVGGPWGDECGEEGDGHSKRLSAALAYLETFINLERRGLPAGGGMDSDKGLDLMRMRLLVQRLGDPVRKYKVVHVAGTKGKGSIVAFVSSILRAAGYRVGTYTSPHVMSLLERITTNEDGAPISEEEFASLVDDHRSVIDAVHMEVDRSLTFFEVVTALAYVHFARTRVDVAVVETGLGGARDATNVIPEDSLSCAVVSAIGYEHTDVLGETIELIAQAKGGIIKPKKPVVLSKQDEEPVERIIASVANAQESLLTLAREPLIFATRVAAGPRALSKNPSLKETVDFAVPCLETLVDGEAVQALCRDSTCGRGAVESRGSWSANAVNLGLVGAHQVENACTAVCVAHILRSQGWVLPDGAIRQGLERARLLGRFQVLSANDIGIPWLNNITIVLDGAHTPASARALATLMQEQFPSKKLIFLVGMAKDKDHSAFAHSILQRCQPVAVILTEAQVLGSFHRTMPSVKLLELWRQAFHALSATNSIDRAQATAEAIVRSLPQGVVQVSEGAKDAALPTKGVTQGIPDGGVEGAADPAKARMRPSRQGGGRGGLEQVQGQENGIGAGVASDPSRGWRQVQIFEKRTVWQALELARALLAETPSETISRRSAQTSHSATDLNLRSSCGSGSASPSMASLESPLASLGNLVASTSDDNLGSTSESSMGVVCVTGSIHLVGDVLKLIKGGEGRDRRTSS